MIIDFHTHTFPDKIAARAIAQLEQASHSRAFTNGTVEGLKASMREAGIGASVVMPVATNPHQVEHVNDASIALNNAGAQSGVYSFGCMHPDYPEPESELERIAASGIKGIKLHPVYQGTDFDDARYIRILKACRQLGLIVLIHAGFDIGFPGMEEAQPEKIRRAVDQVPDLTLVLGHMGSWLCWQKAEKLLSDLGLYIDTSISIERNDTDGGSEGLGDGLQLLSPAEARDIIRSYGIEHTLFGTDSPWDSQKRAVEGFKGLGFTPEELCAIQETNARRLLGI